MRGVEFAPGGGRVALIAAGGAARRDSQETSAANHYALLRTIETQFGLPLLANAALDSTPLLTHLIRGPHPKVRGWDWGCARCENGWADAG